MTDYIIVGGGSAGCVLANRLSADPAVRVTLLEAGGGSNHFLHRMPAGYFSLMKTGRGNWRLETVPQPGLNGERMYVPLGKVLGGSGAVNAMVWVRGNAGDYDDWAAMGNPGWSYADCLPYFRRIENFRGGADAFHGENGPITVSPGAKREALSPISRAWVDAGVAAGYPYNPDLNGITQEGFGPADGNYADGERQSAAKGYLLPVLDRPNLTVITHAHVSRVIVSAGRATGVEYVRKGQLHRIDADAEVILSSGGVHSPTILQRSGIGAGDFLRGHGIKVECDMPSVGENLHDHLAVGLQQRISKPYSALSQLRPWNMARSLTRYLMFKSGPLSGGSLESLAFVKSDPSLAYPDIQFHLPLLMYEDHGRKVIPEEGFLAHATACRPNSRGSVRISAADPFAAPLIDPRYLEDPSDLVPLRAAIRIARDVIAQAPFDGLRSTERAPGADAQSDADLDRFIRANVMSVYHMAGSCRMGTDDAAVVDPTLRVRGIDRLRVVDASIMPRLVTGNTNAPTMMIAEKAAEMIRQGTPAG